MGHGKDTGAEKRKRVVGQYAMSLRYDEMWTHNHRFVGSGNFRAFAPAFIPGERYFPLSTCEIFCPKPKILRR